jgi:hypothetical protein
MSARARREGRLTAAGLGTKKAKILTDADIDRVGVFLGHGFARAPPGWGRDGCSVRGRQGRQSSRAGGGLLIRPPPKSEPYLFEVPPEDGWPGLLRLQQGSRFGL